jgi:hypothetical protein
MTALSCQSLCCCTCLPHLRLDIYPSRVNGVMVAVVCSCRANTGLKGEDFNRNLYIKTLDFATIHVYPQSFALPNTGYQNVNEFFVGGHRHILQACSGTSWHAAQCGLCSACAAGCMSGMLSCLHKALRLKGTE